MSDKQKQILTYLKTVKSARLADIYANTNFGYYHNWEKHLSELLSNMVRRGYIKRIKRGEFAFKSETPLLNKALDQNQLKLFK